MDENMKNNNINNRYFIMGVVIGIFIIGIILIIFNINKNDSIENVLEENKKYNQTENEIKEDNKNEVKLLDDKEAEDIAEEKDDKYSNVIDLEEIRNRKYIEEEIYDSISGEIINDSKLKNEAEKVYNRFHDFIMYQNSAVGPSPKILSDLGLITSEELEKIINDTGIYDPYIYIKSPVKYSDFKGKMLEMMTEYCLNRYYTQYVDMDGYVGFCDCGGGGIYSKVDHCDEIKQIDDNSYIAKIVMIDVEAAEVEGTDEMDNTFNIFVKFKKIDEKLLVDGFENNTF